MIKLTGEGLIITLAMSLMNYNCVCDEIGVRKSERHDRER